PDRVLPTAPGCRTDRSDLRGWHCGERDGVADDCDHAAGGTRDHRNDGRPRDHRSPREHRQQRRVKVTARDRMVIVIVCALAAATSGTPAASSPPSTPGSKTTPGSVAAATALAAPLPPGATAGPAGLPVEQFAFSFNGNFFHLANFFKRLQSFVVAHNKAVSV